MQKIRALSAGCLLILTAALLPAVAHDIPPPFAAYDLASEAVLNDPHDLDIGPDGRIYVADKFGGGIAVFDPSSLELVQMIGAGRFPGIHDISFDASGRAAVAVTGFSTVLVFDRLHGLADVQVPSPVLELPAPRTEGALMHSSGRVYAMASGIGAVIAFEGSEILAVAEGFYGAHDVAEDPEGNIWVADNFNRRLVKLSPDLKILQVLDHIKYGFIGPRYLDIDDFGRLIVADQDAHRILMIEPDATVNGKLEGALVGLLGDGRPGLGPYRFDDPEGALVLDNSYYFADSDNNRIVRYTVVIN